MQLDLFTDNWGVVGLEPGDVKGIKGLHPSKDVDFNIYKDETTGELSITFYGWQKEYNQIDTDNVLGHFKLVKKEW